MKIQVDILGEDPHRLLHLKLESDDFSLIVAPLEFKTGDESKRGDSNCRCISLQAIDRPETDENLE